MDSPTINNISAEIVGIGLVSCIISSCPLQLNGHLFCFILKFQFCSILFFSVVQQWMFIYCLVRKCSELIRTRRCVLFAIFCWSWVLSLLYQVQKAILNSTVIRGERYKPIGRHLKPMLTENLPLFAKDNRTIVQCD